MDDGGDQGDCVLLIEDDDDLREIMSELLTQHGYSIEAVATPVVAFRHLASRRFSAVVTDYLFGSLGSSDSTANAVLDSAGCPVVCTSAWDNIPAATAKRYALILQKPIEPDSLVLGLARLLTPPGAGPEPLSPR